MSITHLHVKYARKMAICLSGSNCCNCCTLRSKQAMMILKGSATSSFGIYPYLSHPVLHYAYAAPTPTPAPALPTWSGYAWGISVEGEMLEKLILTMFARVFPTFFPCSFAMLVMTRWCLRMHQFFSGFSARVQQLFRCRSDAPGYTLAKNLFRFPYQFFWKEIEYALFASSYGAGKGE
jgi:hypothetical protein